MYRFARGSSDLAVVKVCPDVEFWLEIGKPSLGTTMCASNELSEERRFVFTLGDFDLFFDDFFILRSRLLLLLTDEFFRLVVFVSIGCD